VDEIRALAELKQNQLDALKVRAGSKAFSSIYRCKWGSNVLPGTMLAKIVQPANLMPELKVAETQARDVQIRQPHSRRTMERLPLCDASRSCGSERHRHRDVNSRVNSEGGSARFERRGTIDLEHLDDVLYVGRPPSVGEQHHQPVQT